MLSVRRMGSQAITPDFYPETSTPIPTPTTVEETITTNITPLPIPTIASTPLTASVVQPTEPIGKPAGRSKSKKRVGLQEMLARNRNQKEKTAAEAKRRVGLADFLVGL